MVPSIRLILVLHNHQPIGNFDNVFEAAYQDSYKPFLDLFEQYSHLRMALHTSGPLMEWLDQAHGDYLDRIAAHVAAKRIEIIGGPFYEPILSMIPSRDRVGQIQAYTHWLENRVGAQVRGMWIPERVWEQTMTSDLVAAGIQYTVLDDFHFKNAGLSENQLYGYYLTEDDGHLLSVFPGCEPLRYIIPFGQAHEAVDYMREVAHKQPGAVFVFGDDGEKFGVWPHTKKHCFDDGWLRRFFELLEDNSDWIQITTLGETVENVPPLGKIYLPEGSYREMTEWVLPADQLAQYEDVRRDMVHDPRWPGISRFVRGGFWRNYKVKYPEANEMYARMMMVSRRLNALVDAGAKGDLIEAARTELYRGQCNCTYWHGAFGGIYLPHLRNAIYNKLIAADNLLDRVIGRTEPWVEATVDDFNFDGRQEICLHGNRLVAMVAPSQGGQLYELDVRSICHNVLATLSRRPEAYHRKVLLGPDGAGGSVIDAASPVVFKQAGLENRVQYDTYSRKSLLDHFYDGEVRLESLVRGEVPERGDFLLGTYEAKVRRNPGRIQVQMTRQGEAFGIPIKITKGITLQAGSSVLEIAYLLEGLPQDQSLHFAVEMNFAGLPPNAEDRYFYAGADRQHLGHLGAWLDLHDLQKIGLVDEWLGIDVGLTISQPASIWTFPIETVSQSEGGFELVHQSVVVQPHWFVQGDAEGRWSVTMQLDLNTQLAESRNRQS